jgi:hypothetical protein
MCIVVFTYEKSEASIKGVFCSVFLKISQLLSSSQISEQLPAHPQLPAVTRRSVDDRRSDDDRLQNSRLPSTKRQNFKMARP